MKAPPCLRALALLLAAVGPVWAETAAPSANPKTPPAPAPPPEVEFTHVPQYTCDVLMLAVPQEKALPLLPKLRDPKTIDATQAALLDLVSRGEATLIDWLEVTAVNSTRAVTENIDEFRYPIEFEQPQIPSPNSNPEDMLRWAWGMIVPTTFETRNLGSTLEVEAKVSKDCTAIQLQFAVQRVELLGMTDYPAGKTIKGDLLSVAQPQFRTFKTSSNIMLRHGERQLVFCGKPLKPGGPMMIFILGAKVIPPFAKP
jgi:hypothetical protein